MPSRRMIDPGFWESVTVASWPYFDRLLFIGLFSHADDQGRLMGHPVLVRSKVFPFDDVPMDDIITALAKFEASESIIRYSVDGKDYIQLVNWWKWQHAQWAWPSKMPPPSGWEDCHCYRRGNAVVKENWHDCEEEQASPTPPDDPTVAPQSAHDGTGASSAPNNSNSNRGSNSIALEIASTPTTDAAIAPVDAVVGRELLLEFGVREPSATKCGTSPLPHITGWIADARAKGKQLQNPQGYVVGQLKTGIPPPTPVPEWQKFLGDHLCPTCHMHPCACEEFEEVKA